MYRVIVVDDEPWTIVGIEKTFDWAGNGFELVGTMNDAYDALEQAERLRPDLVLTDIRMPEMSGLELIEEIRKRELPCEFVILSGFGEFDYAQQALRYSVLDYLIKPITAKSADQLLKRIRKYLDKKHQESDGLAFEQLSTLPDAAERICQSRGISLSGEKILATAVWGASFDAGQFTENRTALCLPYGSRDGLPLYMLLHSEPLTLLPETVSGVSDKHSGWSEAPRAVKEARLAFQTALFFGYPSYSYAPDSQEPHLRRFELLLNRLTQLIRQGADRELEAYFGELPAVFIREKLDLKHAVLLINHAILLADEDRDGIFRSTDFLMDEFPDFCAACTFLNGLFRKEDAYPPGMENESFRKLYDYVNQHYTEPLSLSGLAAQSFLNFSYASSLFKRTTGQTFSEYLVELRMKRARELLADPSLSISEIGALCGYEDSYYFNKVFKKRHGMPPSAYRAMK